MKKTILGALVANILFGLLNQINAAVYLDEDFSTYVDGNVAGTSADVAAQNGWKQQSTVSTSPIQINSGKLVIGATGQDIYKNLLSTPPNTAGTTLFVRSILNVSAVQSSAGDYFMAFAPFLTTSTATSYWYRVWVAQGTVAGTFKLGFSGASNTVGGYSTDLNLNTNYEILFAFDFVSGTGPNDLMVAYLNPNSSDRTQLTPFLSATFNGTEPSYTGSGTSMNSVLLRQGGTTTGSTINLSELTIASTAAEAGVIPEPSSSMLMVLGAGALVGVRAFRRKQS